jgi:hypothetical protein
MNNRFAIVATSIFWILIILLLRQCCSDNGSSGVGGDVIYSSTSDTVYVQKDTTIFKKGDDIVIHDTDTITRPGDTVFIPDTNYFNLKLQYEELALLYKTRNIYFDSIAIDTFGYAYMLDTIQYNKFQSREFTLDYSIPVITNTEVSEPSHLFYLGGGMSLGDSKINQVQLGLLYKPKKNNVFGIHIGAAPNGTIIYGGSAYWLLNKRRYK